MIQRSLSLGKASMKVLLADRELLLLPLISGAAALATILITVLPLVAVADSAPGIVVGLGFFFVYLALAYITIFFSAALIHGANQRLAGGDPTLGSALRGAASRAGAILPWAIVAATVSLVIRAIRSNDNIVAKILAGLLAAAWASVTFLILPTIVIEGVSFGEASRRAKETVRSRWGDNVTAYVGLGFVSFLLSLPGIGLLYLGANGELLALMVLGAVLLAAAAALSMALSGAYQAALYRYATIGETHNEYFEPGILENTFHR